MAWATPTTYATNGVLTAANLNETRDNLNYLLSGRPGTAVFRDNGSSYTTTSTSFVDIDGTSLAITLTLNGSKVFISFGGVAYNTGASYAYFDISVDGTLVGAAGQDGLNQTTASTNFRSNISINLIKTGLSVGSHTIKPQWRVAANTGTLQAGNGTTTQDTIPFFSAFEVG